MINPDWNHNAVYKRFNKNVVELPVDPSSITYFGLKTDKKIFNPAYSRTSFLILKDGSNYAAYIMIVTADSSYVNGDLTKLAHNTYRKHDADFSGLVMYYTPKGKFLSSWGYKNGVLMLPRSNISTTENNGTSNGSQLVKTNQLTKGTQLIKSTPLHPLTNESAFYVVCTTFYTISYVQGQAVGGTSEDPVCTVISVNGDSPPPTNDPSDGGEGGGGGDATTPCPTGVGTTVYNSARILAGQNSQSAGRILANQAPPGGAPPPDPSDPGFPDPTPQPTTCYVITVDRSVNMSNVPAWGADMMQTYSGSCTFMNMEIVGDILGVNVIESDLIKDYAAATGQSITDVQVNGMVSTDVNNFISNYFNETSISLSQMSASIDNGNPVMAYIVTGFDMTGAVITHEITVYSYNTDSVGNITYNYVDTIDGTSHSSSGTNFGGKISISKK